MKAAHTISAGAAVLLFLTTTAGAGDEIPGRYIVALQAGADAGAVAKTHGCTADVTYRACLNGFAGAVPAARLAALRKDPRVRSAEPDRIVNYVAPMGPAILATRAQAAATETTPTGVNRIDAELNPRTDVSAVGIAIVDTGIDLKHPDLNVAGNVSFVTGAKTGNDDNGHGTHCAGIAAAKVNGIGVRGVAPNAKLYAVKVLNRSGSGQLSWIIAGVDWVTQNAAAKGIRVANMSLGGTFTSPALDASLHNSVLAGVTYCVAAGNSSSDASTFSPANHPDVITVSAIADSNGQCGGGGPATSYGADDTFATFSNFGANVEIAAPGVNIYSTYKGSTYATLSGTSMAAPHVTGAAAQYLATDPGATPAHVRDVLTTLGTAQSPVACTPDATGRLRGGFSGDPDASPEPLLDAAGL